MATEKMLFLVEKIETSAGIDKCYFARIQMLFSTEMFIGCVTASFEQAFLNKSFLFFVRMGKSQMFFC